MKKILFIFLVILNAQSFGQKPYSDIVRSVGKFDSIMVNGVIYTSFGNSVKFLNTITSFSSFTDTSIQAVIVKDTVRGGVFKLYSGSNPADDGIIFSDGAGRKWMREGVTATNIQWFGAKTDGSDCRTSLQNAIQGSVNNLGKAIIYIPSGTFYFDDSVKFSEYVNLFGNGYSSVLKFKEHKEGIIIDYPDAQYSTVSNLIIEGYSGSAFGDSTLWDNSKHGVIIRSPVIFSGVWIRYFDGCGIYMRNDLTNPAPGNTNTSHFNNCHVYNNLMHGIFSEGGDANAMTFNNCDIVANGASGIMDRSFLGNHYNGNHTATNGSPELRYQRGLVKSGGTVYACIKDSTLGHAPPNSTYWQDLGSGWIAFPYVDDYNSSRLYFTVASYVFQGPNQYGTMIGNYAETDQAPGFVDQNNIWMGGGGFSSRLNYPTIISATSGRIVSKAQFKGEHGIVDRFIYGGDKSESIDAYLSYSNFAGIITGSSDKHSIWGMWDYGTEIAEIYTDANNVNYYGVSGKGHRFYSNAYGTTSRLSITSAGKIGIGIDNPDSILHVVGGFKLQDGSQGSGKYLQSDANGGATWASIGQPATIQTLTDAATITWNTNNGYNAQVTLGATGRTLSISNPVAGNYYTIRIIQDATGSRTITTWPTNTKWIGAAAPTLTTTASHYDIVTFYYDGTNYYANYGLNYN